MFSGSSEFQFRIPIVFSDKSVFDQQNVLFTLNNQYHFSMEND